MNFNIYLNEKEKKPLVGNEINEMNKKVVKKFKLDDVKYRYGVRFKIKTDYF